MTIEIIDLGQKIIECMNQDGSVYLPQYRQAKERAKNVVKERKTIISVEGPLGSGKSTAADVLGVELDLIALLENAEVSQIKRYLSMLYTGNKEIQKVGAVGINNAYLVFRMEQYHRALRAARSVVLDRIAVADDIYMEGFIEDGLMTREQAGEIKKRREEEVRILRANNELTAPKEVVIQLKGTGKFFYNRKNRRARDVEIESGGKGVPLAYMQRLTERYNELLPQLLEESGFKGPLVTIPQEVKNDIEFEPTNGRHMLPLMEFLISYLTD